MRSIINIIKQTIKQINPKVCWYPGAGVDIQIINSYLSNSELFDDQLPKLFIFNDLLDYFIDVNGVLRNSRHNSIDLEGYKLVKTFKDKNDLKRWENSLSKDDLDNCNFWKEYENHSEVTKLERCDDNIWDEFDKLIGDNSLEKEHILSQINNFYSTSGLYKKDNNYLLFVNCDNSDLMIEIVNEKINIDSLIVYTHSNCVEFRWLEYLNVKEFCYYQRGNIYTNNIANEYLGTLNSNYENPHAINPDNEFPETDGVDYVKSSEPFRWYPNKETHSNDFGCVYSLLN